MIRSAQLKRGGAIARKTPLDRGGAIVRVTRMRQVGARTERDADALADFKLAVYARADGVCERCGRSDRPLHAHHVVGRAHAPGWEHLHDAEINGAGLCRGGDGCHELVHRHEVDDWPLWIKTRAQVERELVARADQLTKEPQTP